ncbi:glycosyltransferase family 4 protein [Psychromonas sp. psych-6C06]|uniref:glycosyltransferase family 4 protein n=1 Tax=Psychromonas sp. psych-6C06 TaxID=2058089 RepID=UPI001EE6E167|nr:glycosyltransferase family 4 protein [Psychromonas sp. psych-6C06]
MMFSFWLLITIFSWLPKRKERKQKVVVLTGTFYSKNWANAHLLPLVSCPSVKHVYIVSTHLEYQADGLTIVTPSDLSCRYIGHTLARLLCFFSTAVKVKPDYMGGFHILFNASFAILFANILRTRSIYFSGGGVTETLETGASENSYFKFIEQKDQFLTSTICNIIAHATAIITMGKGAKSFLAKNGVNNERIHIISGSIDKSKFYPPSSESPKPFDIVLTARLSAIKQVDLYIDVIAEIYQRGHSCNALIIGDGPLFTELQNYATKSGMQKNITFAGHQDDVLSWLHQSKVYILTSRTEGLSLSLLEGLKAGLPAIVPNVGDLGDVLKDGYNGHLIEKHSKQDFASHIIELIESKEKLEQFSQHAVESTDRFDLSVVQQQWVALFKKGNIFE